MVLFGADAIDRDDERRYEGARVSAILLAEALFAIRDIHRGLVESSTKKG